MLRGKILPMLQGNLLEKGLQTLGLSFYLSVWLFKFMTVFFHLKAEAGSLKSLLDHSRNHLPLELKFSFNLCIYIYIAS